MFFLAMLRCKSLTSSTFAKLRSSSMSDGFIEILSLGQFLSKHKTQSVSFALPTSDPRIFCYIAKDQVEGTIRKDRAIFFVEESSMITQFIVIVTYSDTPE